MCSKGDGISLPDHKIVLWSTAVSLGTGNLIVVCKYLEISIRTLSSTVEILMYGI